jgi:hypothetical protein
MEVRGSIIVFIFAGVFSCRVLAAPVEFAQGLRRITEIDSESAEPVAEAGEERAEMAPVAGLPLAEPELSPLEQASGEEPPSGESTVVDDGFDSSQKQSPENAPMEQDIQATPFADRRSLEAGIIATETSRFTVMPPSVSFSANIVAMGGETGLLLRQGDVMHDLFSLSADLNARVAKGVISQTEALQIAQELMFLQGAYYRIPVTARELLAALGFAPDGAASVDDLREILAVHIQVTLGTSVRTAGYLAEVVWYLTMNRD